MKRNATSPTLALDPTPHPAPFPYRDWTQARDELDAQLRRGTFYALVTGPSGTGKTSLCHALTTADGDARGPILYLSASRVSLLGVVRYALCARRRLSHHCVQRRGDRSLVRVARVRGRADRVRELRLQPERCGRRHAGLVRAVPADVRLDGGGATTARGRASRVHGR